MATRIEEGDNNETNQKKGKLDRIELLVSGGSSVPKVVALIKRVWHLAQFIHNFCVFLICPF